MHTLAVVWMLFVKRVVCKKNNVVVGTGGYENGSTLEHTIGGGNGSPGTIF